MLPSKVFTCKIYNPAERFEALIVETILLKFPLEISAPAESGADIVLLKKHPQYPSKYKKNPQNLRKQL